MFKLGMLLALAGLIPAHAEKEIPKEISDYYSNTRNSLNSVLQDINAGDISMDKPTAQRMTEALRYCLDTVDSLENRGVKGSYQAPPLEQHEERPKAGSREYREQNAKSGNNG